MNAKLQFVVLLVTLAMVPSEQVSLDLNLVGKWILFDCVGKDFNQDVEIPNYLLTMKRKGLLIDYRIEWTELIGTGIMSGTIESTRIGYKADCKVDKQTKATSKDNVYEKFRLQNCDKIKEFKVSDGGNKFVVEYNGEGAPQCTYVRYD